MLHGYSAVSALSYEDPEHRTVASIPQLCQGNQMYAAHVQVSPLQVIRNLNTF